ncbi:MAG: hypothetical protein J1G04_04410 [Clostridiales bacterium]|nr:hypothetical protein [Clostridiales bacterium]
MSRKSKLKKAIQDREVEIRTYELKRERSQTAIIRAMLNNTKPAKEDVQYFNLFSDLIDETRKSLRMLNEEFKKLTEKE